MAATRGRLPWLGVFVLLLAACSAPDQLDGADAGRTLVYNAEEPTFDLDARVRFAGQPASDDASAPHVPDLHVPALHVPALHVPALHVMVSLDPATLVAEADGMDGERQRVRYQLAVVARDAESNRVLREQVWTDTLRAGSPEAVRALPLVLHETELQLGPGTYLLEARLDDLSAESEGVRRMRIQVPSDPQAPRLGRLVVASKQAGRWVPYLGRSMAVSPESLHVRAEVVGEAAEVALRIEQLPSDTTVARPPHWLAPSRGSVVYQGVRMSEPTVVHDMVQAHTGGAAALSFSVPPLVPGLYRLQLQWHNTEGGNEESSQGEGAPQRVDAELSVRHLAVFAPGHPRVDSVERLIESLAYLAYERERAYILDGDTPEEQRRRFDAFWGTLLGDRRVAANVLRLYYERVEEANRRFSTVKEGWKTDRGMLFILLGPPTYVEREAQRRTWYYGSGLRQDASAFTFVEVDDFGQPPGWQPFQLQRRAAYEAVWAQALRRWRSGRMR
ncbi:MAG: GWxTD domain-containing protein [Bacteroidota bacterium]